MAEENVGVNTTRKKAREEDQDKVSKTLYEAMEINNLCYDRPNWKLGSCIVDGN